MLRRSVDVISLVLGGAFLGAFGYYQYDKLRSKPPVLFPTYKTRPKEISIMKDIPDIPNTGPVTIRNYEFLQMI